MMLTEKKQGSGKTKARRRLAMVSRWLHIYLSMVSFTIVLFFSATGLTLNHVDWFQSAMHTSEQKGKLDSSWTNPQDTNRVNKLAVVEFFRNRYKVKGALNDFRIEETQISLAFKGPGYEAAGFIDRQNGQFELTETSAGFIGFLNDLHKGRDTGSIWSWVIDISAVLMVLISLTGLILLLFIKKKRMAGVAVALIGSVLVYLVYHFWGQ
jgi:hypothetical protein